MYIADEELVLSGTPFTMLFDQESTIGQHLDLVINVSENEFSDEEYLDLPFDIGSDNDYLDELLVNNDTILIGSNRDGTNVCIPDSCGNGITTCADKIPKPSEICQSVSGKKQYDTDSSDECLEDSVSHARKERFRFLREMESIMVVHPLSLDWYRKISSNNNNMAEGNSELSPAQLSSTADKVVDAGVAEHLQFSKFSSVFCLSPKVCSSDDSDDNSEISAYQENLTERAEHTDQLLSISPPCLHKNVKEHAEAMSAVMPAQNILDRLGPKVPPCERIVLISEPCEISANTIDITESQHHNNGVVAEAESLSDQGNSPCPETPPDSSDEVYESSQIALLDSPEKLPPSLPASPDLPVPPDISDNVNCQVSTISNSDSRRSTKAPYVSNDPAENNDNDDPNWQYMCCLHTDDERYKVVRQRWKNLTIPNPNQNLTFQNYRKRLETNQRANVNLFRNAKNKRKRSLTESVEMVGPKAKRFRSNPYTCSSLFNDRIEKISVDLQRKVQDVKSNYEMRMRNHKENYFASRNAQANRYHGSQNLHQYQYDEQAYGRNLFYKLSETLRNYRNECMNKVDKLNESLEEMIKFHRFYSGLKNSSNDSGNADALSKQQVLEIMEQEHMYIAYDNCYR